MIEGTSIRFARWQIALLGCLSIALVTTVNRAVYEITSRLAPRFDWLADSCVGSLTVCVGIYVAIRPARPFALPVAGTNWSRVLRLSGLWLAIWLGCSVIAAAAAGHWIAYTHGVVEITAFLLLGPLQEELLFRGAIFELAERAWPRVIAWTPIVVSTLLFSLHHLQLHHYRLTPAALGQMAFTIPMGLVFGLLRRETKSLWPGLTVHFLSNLPGAFGS